jgi:hypothetical protein
MLKIAYLVLSFSTLYFNHVFVILLCYKKSWNIPKGQSKDVNRRRTGNAMVKRKKTNNGSGSLV